MPIGMSEIEVSQIKSLQDWRWEQVCKPKPSGLAALLKRLIMPSIFSLLILTLIIQSAMILGIISSFQELIKIFICVSFLLTYKEGYVLKRGRLRVNYRTSGLTMKTTRLLNSHKK